MNDDQIQANYNIFFEQTSDNKGNIISIKVDKWNRWTKVNKFKVKKLPNILKKDKDSIALIIDFFGYSLFLWKRKE